MGQQLLFFFSAIGAFNGLFLSLYFLFKRSNQFSNRLLGFLFLAVSIRVEKSVFFYFYESIADFYIQFGLLACWLIGPLLYFYIKSVVYAERGFQKVPIYSLVSLAVFGLLVNIFYPWSNYPNLWNIFVRAIYLQWSFFVILSGLFLVKTKGIWLLQNNNKPFKLWLFSIYFGYAMICLAYNTAHYTSYIVGALSCSFVFYMLLLLLIFYKRRDELLSLRQKKYLRNRMRGEEAELLQNRLDELFQRDKLFLDSNLSLKKISNLLNVSTVKLSQVLNEHSKTSFNDYVNAYRIDEAKLLITNESSYSLEAIAMDCGFNSKSTFYSAFKKRTGFTPAHYRRQHT